MHATSGAHHSPAAPCAATEGQPNCSCHRGKAGSQRQAHLCAPHPTPHLRTTWDTLEMPASSAASAESVTALTCSSHALLAAATLLSHILAAQGEQGRAEGEPHGVELVCQAAAGRPAARGSAQVPRRSTVGLASAPSHPTQAAGLSKRLNGSDAAATVRPRRRRRAGAPNPRACACAGLPTCVCLNGAQAEAAAAAAAVLLAAAGVGHGV